MLDRKLLRTNFDEINKRLEHRGEDLSDLVKFGELDEKRRELISKVEELKAERNEATKQISELKKNKEDATEAITAMRALRSEERRVGKNASAQRGEAGTSEREEDRTCE